MASRTKKVFLNTSFELLLELVTAICSFILPRLILSHFGSSYNGITLSIAQFIGCISLLKSGIGSVTRAALYQPLAQKNYLGISEIVNATQGFMRKVAILFSICCITFACLYPFIVDEDFTWFFSFSLVLIISSSTFAQYFWGLPYQMVLQADQKVYIISIVTIVSTIVNTCIAAIFIFCGFSIHLVKLGSAMVFILPPLFYYFYVKRKYHIDNKITPNYKLISQRWDAFGHQLANFVNTNTDIIIITIILGVKSVSIYAIYYMVADAIKKVVLAFSNGTTAAFGNIIAKEETNILKNRFEQFEVIIFYLSTTLLIITAVLLVPFISLYTEGINDVNYKLPTFSFFVSLSVFLACIKVPYEQLVFAAGKFKQTRNAAFIEAFIHISASVLLALVMGLNGIVIGFIISAIYRITLFHIFLCKDVLPRPYSCLLKKFAYSGLTVIFIVLIVNSVTIPSVDSYYAWIAEAIFVFFIVFIISTILVFVFFKKEMTAIISLISKRIKRR